MSIESRLSTIERKAAARSTPRHYCTCPPELITRPAVSVNELPQEQGKRPPSRINGTCHRCGGVFSKDHPAPPTIILQPVKAKKD